VVSSSPPTRLVRLLTKNARGFRAGTRPWSRPSTSRRRPACSMARSSPAMKTAAPRPETNGRCCRPNQPGSMSTFMKILLFLRRKPHRRPDIPLGKIRHRLRPRMPKSSSGGASRNPAAGGPAWRGFFSARSTVITMRQMMCALSARSPSPARSCSQAPPVTGASLERRFPGRSSRPFRQRLGHRHKRKRALLVSYDNCVSAQISPRFYCVSPKLPGGF
jgi:hypothetical protein